MSFNPRQLRGPDGRWISMGGGKKVRRAARSKANKSAYKKKKRRSSPITIDRAASRRQRGVGFSGLKKNFIPYARVSKKSATVGANTGTFIPGTNKRIVFGNYARLESTNRSNKVDAMLSKTFKKLAPKGTRRAAIGQHIKKNAKISNPAVRYSTPGTSSRHGTEIRLGTSRKAGPTLTVRRGTHKRSRAESRAGIAQYDRRMKTIQGKKVSKPRPTRRRQAAARKNRKRRNK